MSLFKQKTTSPKAELRTLHDMIEQMSFPDGAAYVKSSQLPHDSSFVILGTRKPSIEEVFSLLGIAVVQTKEGYYICGGLDDSNLSVTTYEIIKLCEKHGIESTLI